MKKCTKPSSFLKNIILSLPCMLIKNTKIKFVALKLYLSFCRSISTFGTTNYSHLQYTTSFCFPGVKYSQVSAKVIVYVHTLQEPGEGNLQQKIRIPVTILQ